MSGILSENLRNIGIMAHIDAGKTTTTERILFYTKKIHKIGEVHDGTATTDWMIQEQERGITITSAAVSCSWRGYQINLLDTPGHVDFTVEVERSLRVLDGAVAIFDGVAGVEPQSETVWHQADRYKIPRIVFINKLDRVGADFHVATQTIVRKLGACALPFQIPIGKEEHFTGVVDLLSMEALIWTKDNSYGEHYETTKIPPDLLNDAKVAREMLLETLIEHDDSMMERYLNNEQLSCNELKNLARQLTLDLKIVPVLAGSAFKNKGIQPLLQAIVDFLPAPVDIKTIEGLSADKHENILTRQRSVNEAFSAIAFKLATDPFIGQLIFVRIYSGSIKPGDVVLNTRTGKTQRIQKILRMHSNQREELSQIKSGDICAFVGIKHVITGDTLADVKHPIRFESVIFPDPVISIAAEANTKVNRDKLLDVCELFMKEDPTFRAKENPETGQILMSGMGELHLEIILDRLKREFNLDIHTGSPEVSYRETLTKSIRSEQKHFHEGSGTKQFAHVILKLSPYEGEEENSSFLFKNNTPEETVPKRFMPSIKRGISSALQSGPLAGFPVINIQITLVGGSFQQSVSNEQAFQIATTKAVSLGLQKRELALLEPVMSLEIISPKNYLSNVLSDLNGRQAKIQNITDMDPMQRILATAPLSRMFGYSTSLRSLSQGRGTYSMKFGHYKPVSNQVFQKITGKIKVEL